MRYFERKPCGSLLKCSLSTREVRANVIYPHDRKGGGRVMQPVVRAAEGLTMKLEA